jgi:4-amino-4-deoxy-L-arabinose transferase-like glycosyltransferase
VLRAVYPYPIDGLEPGALQEVERVLSAQPLYVAPTLEYVPQIYGPLYFYLAAALAALSGSAQFGLRAMSLLASLGSIALIAQLVCRETGSLPIGLFAGGLLSTCNQLVQGAMDIGRTDATALFFLLAATSATRRAVFQPKAGWRASAVAGCLLGLAVLTKQSAAAVAVALIGLVLVLRTRQLVACVGAFAATLGLALGALVLQSGHWPVFYLWDLPRTHQILPELVWRMWGEILPGFAAAALIGPLFLVACAMRGQRARVLFYSAVPLSMIGMAWASQATIRGARNVELPAYAALSVLAGLGLHLAIAWIGSASRTARIAQAYALAAAAGLLLTLTYNPRFQVPYRSDDWAGDRLTARLAALPGPIFAGAYQGYVRPSPNVVAPDLEAVVELQGEQVRPSTPEGDQWGNALGTAVVNRQFTYLIVNPDIDGFIVPQVARAYGYVDLGPLFPPGDIYWSWRTSWAPKAEVYARPGLPLPPPPN